MAIKNTLLEIDEKV